MTAGPLVGVILFDFDPYLRLGDVAVRWETLALAGVLFAAIILAGLIAGRTPGEIDLIGDVEADADEAEGPWHLRRDDLLFIALGVVVGAVVGGRLGYGLLHADYYEDGWRELLDPGRGSLELTLAVVGGTLTGIYVAALLGAPVGRWLRVAIVPVLLALGLGKAAEVLGGAGQGQATTVDWATAFLPPGPWGSAGAEIPAHPSQLYEAGVTLLVLLVVVLLARLTPLGRGDGRLYAVGIGLWAIGRGLVASTWRDPEVVAGLNAEQLLCLVVASVMLGAAAIATIAGRRRASVPRARAA